MFDYNDVCKQDLVFFKSRVITVDPDFTIADAVAIKGEKIMAVRDNESIPELHGDRTKLIDLKGKVLMPGIMRTCTCPESQIKYIRVLLTLIREE